MPDLFAEYRISAKSSIGPRYRRLLFDMLLACDFRHVLEIGCLRGYSTCAFLEALKRGASFSYTICDIEPRPGFTELIGSCAGIGAINLVRQPSLEAIGPEFDFVFVDGDHSIAYVRREIARLLEVHTPTILAHDTYIEDPRYAGAHLYRHTFSRHPDFFYIDDDTWMPGEQQRCGLSLCTRSREVFDRVAPLFRAAKATT